MSSFKNILQIGYGNFGRHHCTSLLNRYNVFVHDPTVQKFNDGINKVKELKSMEGLYFELVIIAVNANLHLELANIISLLDIKTKDILIEKVPDNQLNKNLSELEKSLLINFPRRYYPFYIKLKEFCKNNIIKSIKVEGGNNSLLCNALHYIDIAEYITDTRFNWIDTELSDVFPARREGFFDGLGTINCSNESLSLAIINRKSNSPHPNEISISFRDGSSIRYIERVGIEENSTKFQFNDQIVINQSELTVHYLTKNLLPRFSQFQRTNSLFLQSLADKVPVNKGRVLIT